MAEQAPRYATLSVPITIIAGDADKTVSTHIHSQPLARTAQNTKLIVLNGVGHMIQYARARSRDFRGRGDGGDAYP